MRRILPIVALVLLLLLVPSSVLGDIPDDSVTVTATPDYPTDNPVVEALPATGVGTTTATLHGNVTDAKGGIITMRGFEWGYSSGSYLFSWNETGNFGVGTFSSNISGLDFGTQVFWRAFAVNGYGTGNSTELTFYTVGILDPPTNFVATQIGIGSVNLTWVMGIGANTTVIRISEGSCPESYNEGYLVYSSNGTSVVVEGLTLTYESYCIRAWSASGGDYSEGYAELRIGGTSMIAIALIILAVCLTALFFWRRNIVFAMGSSMSWLALGILLVVDPGTIGFPALTESWVQVLAYIFFIMAAGCLLWFFGNMGKIKITQTDIRTGKTWETYGKVPKVEASKESRSDRVKRERKETLRNVRRRVGR